MKRMEIQTLHCKYMQLVLKYSYLAIQLHAITCPGIGEYVYFLGGHYFICYTQFYPLTLVIYYVHV